MLNITTNSIKKRLETSGFSAFQRVEDKKLSKYPKYMIWGATLLVFISLFLPWTQNVHATGELTTLTPEQRPQSLQSVISGRLEKWYVREGDFVRKGDTIIFISEVKSDYFDPELLTRTEEQVRAKEQSIGSYGDKMKSLEQQYAALESAKNFKIQQTRNKIEQNQLKIRSANADLVAYETDAQIAQNQLNRTQELYNQGIKSLTDLEAKRLKYQEVNAKVISQRNKLLTLKNEQGNLQIELSGIASEYADKMAKSQSEKFSAQTSQLDAAASTSKLKNQLGNYEQRQKFYYITAPQSGYITQTIKKGVGEIIKEGSDILTIMPSKINFAAQVWVRPIDMPLLNKGQEVRLQFDGWPAIVFSGWPDASFGTFTGEIVAIDRFISDNGKYRILVAPTKDSKNWPEQLRVGSGANTFVLLKNVPVWYELWRQLNGFPPDFYGNKKSNEKKSK